VSDGHESITPPWRRETHDVALALVRWAAASDRGPVTDVYAPASGMANETVLFRLAGEPLVARLAPGPGSPFPTFPNYDLDYQRRVMELVQQRTAQPVPKVVHLEKSDEWLGAPFLLLEAVEGVVPGDNPPYVFGGWLAEATEQERRLLEESSIRVLVDLHTIEDQGATEFLRRSGDGETPLARELAFQRAYYEWANEGTSVPALEHAFEVLAETMPATGYTCLNWGDSRIGNIIYRDFAPAAVLDWEMATVGPAEVDLGWMVFFHAFFQGIADQYGAPGIPELFVRERVVATYESLAGRRLLDLAWFEALAALRFGIISVRTSLRSIAFGLQEAPKHPDDLVMHAPQLQRLLEEL
jgi:aminoglycoside phosphotransferase (APT) family kinase protein